MKRSIITFTIIAFVTAMAAVPAFANKSSLPAHVVTGIDKLLESVCKTGKNAVDTRHLEDVAGFVIKEKSPQDKIDAGSKKGISSAYYEFPINTDMKTFLKYVFNPAIPACATLPSSVRLSRWNETHYSNMKKDSFWEHLSDLNVPVVLKGTEQESNTPDLTTGAYYKYDTDRMLVLTQIDGHNVFISVAKQKDRSSIGKMGLIVGPDEDWNYYYTQKTGINKPGISWATSWVKTYIYDSYSVMVFYEDTDKQGKPFVKCGAFKWLSAGWSGMNMVKSHHIYKGLIRYSSSLKEVMESANLPKHEQLEEIVTDLKQLPEDAIKQRAIKLLKDKGEKALPKSTFSIDSYVSDLSREEVLSLIVREYMRTIMKKTSNKIT